MARVIFHIDLNAFYTSAEVVRNHALEGLPIVVGGHSKRGVVCTASYEARAYGVHSAMPLFKALELCPKLIVLDADFDWYKQLSRQFFDCLRSFSPLIEIASIDECYMDVSELIKSYKRPLDLAWQIQKEVKEKVFLPCSIGVGPNKFLAKMASDMRKPMGITVLRKQEIQKKLWPLSIDDMYGIGKKSAVLLKEHGVLTIKDVADPKNEDYLLKVLGKQGRNAILNARGQGNDVLTYNSTVQSLSQSTTMNHDVEEYAEIAGIIKTLSMHLSKRAKEKQMEGKLISLSIRYYNFKNVVRSTNLDVITNDCNIIYEHAMTLLDQYYEGMPVRHLGISLGSLKSQKEKIEQITIFNKLHKPIDILEELNKEVNGTLLMYASDLLKKDHQ